MLPDISTKITSPILDAFSEIQKPRSKFQLQNFVVNQHDTDEMRYVQTVQEIQHLYYTIRLTTLELKKMEIEVERLRSSGDEIEELEAQMKELNLEQARIVGIGAFRELDNLLEIFNSFPIKYTREQIEQAQPEYWNKRLTRQSDLEMIGGSPSQAENLNAMRQIGLFDLDGVRAEIEKNNRKELEQ